MTDKPRPRQRTPKDMTPAERAEMLANYKPPRPTPVRPFRCARRTPEGRGEDVLELSAICTIREGLA